MKVLAIISTLKNKEMDLQTIKSKSSPTLILKMSYAPVKVEIFDEGILFIYLKSKR